MKLLIILITASLALPVYAGWERLVSKTPLTQIKGAPIAMEEAAAVTGVKAALRLDGINRAGKVEIHTNLLFKEKDLSKVSMDDLDKSLKKAVETAQKSDAQRVPAYTIKNDDDSRIIVSVNNQNTKRAVYIRMVNMDEQYTKELGQAIRDSSNRYKDLDSLRVGLDDSQNKFIVLTMDQTLTVKELEEQVRNINEVVIARNNLHWKQLSMKGTDAKVSTQLVRKGSH